MLGLTWFKVLAVRKDRSIGENLKGRGLDQMPEWANYNLHGHTNVDIEDTVIDFQVVDFLTKVYMSHAGIIVVGADDVETASV